MLLQKKFIPERLIETRERMQFTQTQLAHSLGLSRQAIAMYESGKMAPDPDRVSALSQTLRVPYRYFFKERPRLAQVGAAIFFRKQAGAAASARRAAGREVEWLIDIVSAVQKRIALPAVSIPSEEGQDIDEISNEWLEDKAIKLREAWGLGVGPIWNIAGLLETHGVILATTSVSSKIDAFSVYFNAPIGRPVLFLNSEASKARRRFTLLHELGHMIFHKHCTSEFLNNLDAAAKLERQADYFAGAFLMPKVSLRQVFKKPATVTLSELLRVKAQWGVSVQCLITRLFQLGDITVSRRTYLHKRISELGMNRRDPADDELELKPAEEPVLLRKALTIIALNERSQRSFEDEVALSWETITSLLSPDKPARVVVAGRPGAGLVHNFGSPLRRGGEERKS